MKNKRNRNTPDYTGKVVCLTRYTENTWMKSYPQSNHDEWAMMSQPHNICEFLDDTVIATGMDECPPAKIRVAVLDEEY